MFIDFKALEGIECETPIDAQLLLNADDGGNALRGLAIATALSTPFWAAFIYGLSTII